MRRTTYRQEEWATLPPSFGAVGTRPLDEKPLPPTLIMLPGDVKAAKPLDSWSFSDTIALDAGDGLRVKILAIDTSVGTAVAVVDVPTSFSVAPESSAPPTAFTVSFTLACPGGCGPATTVSACVVAPIAPFT